MSVGCAAVCFGKVWEFHNHLEDGQIRLFWGIHRTENLLFLFHTIKGLRYILDWTIQRCLGVMLSQESRGLWHIYPCLESLLSRGSRLG
ncbi:hypothetical protein U1Q18_028018, partial [Sarracenia purpurea var. burkii]